MFMILDMISAVGQSLTTGIDVAIIRIPMTSYDPNQCCMINYAVIPVIRRHNKFHEHPATWVHSPGIWVQQETFSLPQNDHFFKLKGRTMD